MIVLLDDSLFGSNDVTQASTLCVLIAHSHHMLFFDSSTAAYQQWAAAVPAFAARVTGYLNSSAQRINSNTAAQKVIVVNEPTDWSVTPARLGFVEALRFLSLPTRIFVENGESDRAFLMAFMSANQRAQFMEAERNGWLQVVSAGGIGELPKVITREVSFFKGTSLRALAFFDSDALKRNSPSPDSERVSSLCARHGLAFHRLERRAIENYLPCDALMTRANRAKREHRAVSLFKLLPEEHRDHFNMKEGLLGDRRRAESAYALPYKFEYARQLLNNGFGSDAWLAFLPEHFDHAKNSDDYRRAFKEVSSIVASVFRLI